MPARPDWRQVTAAPAPFADVACAQYGGAAREHVWYLLFVSLFCARCRLAAPAVSVHGYAQLWRHGAGWKRGCALQLRSPRPGWRGGGPRAAVVGDYPHAKDRRRIGGVGVRPGNETASTGRSG